MPKPQTQFACQSCGAMYPRWMGQCSACGEWNTIVEETSDGINRVDSKLKIPQKKTENPKASPITKVDFNQEDRLATGIEEFDRVLGGGIVEGSVILVAGEPGIGKSTLMMQAAAKLAASQKILYVSAEESSKQIRQRAGRLNALSDNIMVLAETDLFAIEKAVEELNPKVLIVDSVQTIFREDISSAPGSVSQVRECANYLVRIAKNSGLPIFLVGHVTKEGNIAGPRVLEHVVDVVLYFEGERYRQYRILRANKNRFGSTNEIGIFEMRDKGLFEIENPSLFFISERNKESYGSVIGVSLEGSRPLMVEIQALVSFTKMAMPRRVVSGISYNRCSMIIAALEQFLGMKLSSQDVHVNVAGGVQISEPAVDLAVALAIASSHKKKPADFETAAVGEVGLTGEVRSVSRIESRIKEAEKMGFKNIIIPKGNLSEIDKKNKIKISPVASLKEAVLLLF